MRHSALAAPAILSFSDPLFGFQCGSIMGDKVRALHQGGLMDIFYNHLSAFSAVFLITAALWEIKKKWQGFCLSKRLQSDGIHAGVFTSESSKKGRVRWAGTAWRKQHGPTLWSEDRAEEENVSSANSGSGQGPVGGKITWRTDTLLRLLNTGWRIWTSAKSAKPSQIESVETKYDNFF